MKLATQHRKVNMRRESSRVSMDGQHNHNLQLNTPPVSIVPPDALTAHVFAIEVYICLRGNGWAREMIISEST